MPIKADQVTFDPPPAGRAKVSASEVTFDDPPKAKPVDTAYFDRLKHNSPGPEGAPSREMAGMGGAEAFSRSIVRGLPIVGPIIPKAAAALSGMAAAIPATADEMRSDAPIDRDAVYDEFGNKIGGAATAAAGGAYQSTVAADDKSQKDNPKLSIAGEIVGGVGFPAATSLSTAVGLGGKAARGGLAVGEGAMYGAAKSDKTKPEDVAKDGAVGGLFGAVGLGVAKGVGWVGDRILKPGVKQVTRTLGLDDVVSDRPPTLAEIDAHRAAGEQLGFKNPSGPLVPEGSPTGAVAPVGKKAPVKPGEFPESGTGEQRNLFAGPEDGAKPRPQQGPAELQVTEKLVPGAAETSYQKQVRKAVGNGATPTELKRAFPDHDSLTPVVDLIEKTPELKKAVKAGDQEKIVEVTQQELDKLSQLVKPVYDDLDAAVGKVPIAEIRKAIQAEIGDIETNFARRNEMARVGVLKDLEADLVSRAEKAYGADGTADAIKHQDLRQWVTSILKEKNQVVGAMAETPTYAFRHDNHMLVNGILNEHLDNVAKVHPELAKRVDYLRNVNRDISAAGRMNGVAENAVDQAARKEATLGEQAGRKVGGAVNSGVIGFAVGGAPAAATAAVARTVAPPLARKLTEKAVAAAGLLGRQIRKGNVSLEDINQAIDAGVPRAVVRAMTGRSPAEIPDEE